MTIVKPRSSLRAPRVILDRFTFSVRGRMSGNGRANAKRKRNAGLNSMSTIVLYDEIITIPPWVVNLDSFRNWARSDDFPDTGRICYLGEEGVWVDISK